MPFYLSIIAYLIYMIIVVQLIITSIVSSFISQHFIITIFKGFIFLFLLYELLNEWFKYLSKKRAALLIKQYDIKYALIFASVLISTLLTYLLNHYIALGAVVSSALIGMIGATLFKDYDVPIYCGSFAGMVSINVIPNTYGILIVSALTGLFYIMGIEVFRGFGGKLGATAYFATLSAAFLTGRFNETMLNATVKLPPWIFIFFIIGAISTYVINIKLKTGVVLSSSIVGLIGGLILPNIFLAGTQMAIALFCGTFIGMSAAEKLCFKKCIIIASIVGSILFAYTNPYFSGLGGKLGLIAFSSSIATAGYYNLKKYLMDRINKTP